MDGLEPRPEIKCTRCPWSSKLDTDFQGLMMVRGSLFFTQPLSCSLNPLLASPSRHSRRPSCSGSGLAAAGLLHAPLPRASPPPPQAQSGANALADKHRQLVGNSAESFRRSNQPGQKDPPSLNVKAAALTSALGLERAPFAALLAELGLGAYTEEVHVKALAGLGRHPQLLADLAERQEARRAEAPEESVGRGGAREEAHEGEVGGAGERQEGRGGGAEAFSAAEKAVAGWATSQNVAFPGVSVLNETLPTGARFETPALLRRCQASGREEETLV